MLQVQNIESTTGSKNNVTKALDRISFEVQSGEFIAIMGASGSGKTTLLNCISTIDSPSAGSILLNGESIAGLPETELAPLSAGAAGVRVQDFNLLDTLTLEENIGLALTINHADPRTVQSRVREVASSWELRRCWKSSPIRYPAGKSSGRPARGPWWPSGR